MCLNMLLQLFILFKKFMRSYLVQSYGRCMCRRLSRNETAPEVCFVAIQTWDTMFEDVATINFSFYRLGNIEKDLPFSATGSQVHFLRFPVSSRNDKSNNNCNCNNNYNFNKDNGTPNKNQTVETAFVRPVTLNCKFSPIVTSYTTRQKHINPIHICMSI